MDQLTRLMVMCRYSAAMERVRALGKQRDRGATAVEYGLLVALIALGIIGAVTILGGKLSTMFTDVAGKIASTPASTST